MRLIDTHCHLNFPDLFPDPEPLIEEARESGVDRLIVVGCDRETSAHAVALAERFEGLFAVVGWHPTSTANFTLDELGPLREWLAHPKVVALGEIGLDYHWDYSTPEQQAVALHAQLDLAAELGAPVVFHCRKAYPDLLDVLEARPPHPYLFHCWSGNPEEAARAMALDAWFGVDGPVTYKSAHELRAILKTVPREKIVIETDSPYMSPEPFRGKPNVPARVTLVNGALASVLGMAAEECAALTTRNAEAFFRLA